MKSRRFIRNSSSFHRSPASLCYVAKEDPNHSALIPVNGQPIPAFNRAWLLTVITKATEPAHIAEARFVDSYDSHYPGRHRELPLPVLYVRLNDEQNSSFHIDPATRVLPGSYSSGQWVERWLYTHRPA